MTQGSLFPEQESAPGPGARPRGPRAARRPPAAAPGPPPIPDQEFFTMGEACRVAQVAPHTLRYWETELGRPRPARRPSGHRRYGRGDIETIFQIKALLRERGMTLAGARRALSGRRRAQAEGSAASRRLLGEIRAELRELVSELGK
ncbi:MAG: MerR family transcriptional regulator [Elusimicrobia bacterium]|nr:MerR family transcriptional regulator [Elusimicrobiota bacterium]